MATAPTSNIGTVYSVVAGVPATDDEAGYTAQTGFVEIGKFIALPATGNKSVAGTTKHVKTGVQQHFNGTKMVDPFALSYTYIEDDAGQVILRANENGTAVVTLEEAHIDGTKRYIQGVIGDVIQSEIDPDSEKGETATFRPITIWTYVGSS